jgi:hemerythrin-like domain-containing protein
MRCTELVFQDHVILRRALDVLDWMVKTLDDGARIEIADVTVILEFLRHFGDEYHQTMEERVLFPALLRAAPDEASLRQILSEHVEERVLVAGIEEALRFRRGMDFARNSRRLSVLLRSHLEKEDAVFLYVSERLLSKEDDNRIMDELTADYRPPEVRMNFSRLEWKYRWKPQGLPLVPVHGIAKTQVSGSYK